MADPQKPTPPADQPGESQPKTYTDADIEAARAEARREALAEAADKASPSASAAVKKLKDSYKVPKGEEDFTHVAITHLHGQELAEPQVKAFDAHTYATSISKQAGFKGEILHKGKSK